MKETDNGRVLEVGLSDRLVKHDYEEFVPKVEQMLKVHGKINLLVEMNDFHGWTPSALWEDVKFDAHHFHDIDRLAIVGDKRWHRGAAMFCKPFTSAAICYFESEDRGLARAWLKEQTG